jgi:predicted DNA-binding ArsR family transcriptional regulator
LKTPPKLVYKKDTEKKLLKDDLRALCDDNDIMYTKKDNISDLTEALARNNVLINSITRKSYIVELNDDMLETAFINLCN